MDVPGGTVVKNPPASAGDGRRLGSIPGLTRPLKEMAAHPSILAWKIRGMVEPGRLLSVGSQRVRHD